MIEPVYIIRKSSTGAMFHYDGEVSWLNKSHELMSGEIAFLRGGPIRDAINEGGKPEAYVPLDLLRRCIEAFKKANEVALGKTGDGCVSLAGWDSQHWNCGSDCPICEAVRVLGVEPS